MSPQHALPGRLLRSWSRRLWLAAIGVFSTACSVADNLSGGEILRELDGIVQIEKPDGNIIEHRVGYAERAPVSAWYMRAFLFVPFRSFLGLVLGRQREELLENPVGHVRHLLRELPDETSGDLLLCGLASSRLGWIAELETNAESRVVALDGLCRIAAQLELAPFSGDLDQIGAVADKQRIDTARVGLQVSRPEVRRGANWEDSQLSPFLAALTAITELPLEGRVERLTLVEDLTALFLAETDARVRPAAARALRRSIEHLLQRLLLGIVEDRDPRFIELRLCAMEQIRRLGGPRTVPLLLAIMAASPAQLARPEARFDTDPMIKLRLVHYCGQLSGELARTVVRLPGRADWQSMSPTDFLVTTILTEQAYYSKLRTPALAALTLSLRRPRLNPDPSWVREWRENQQP